MSVLRSLARKNHLVRCFIDANILDQTIKFVELAGANPGPYKTPAQKNESNNEKIGLVAPARGVGAWGRGLQHVRLGFSQDALGEGEAAFAGSAAWGACVAVGLVDTVVEGGVGVRRSRGFQGGLH